MNSEEIIKKRINKIKTWFKDPYNLALVGILAFALIIRIYFFSLTKTQGLWWDEAEYLLKAKAIALGTPETGWYASRELVVPILFSFIFKIGLGEISIRFVQVIISFLTVFFTYLVAKEMFSKEIALYSSLLMSFFWLHIFFTMRVLVYLWAPLMFLIIVFLFWKGYIKKSSKHLYLFGFVSAIGLMIYFSVGFLLLTLFIFILFNQKLSFLKNKKLWMALLIFFLSLAPYMIYSQITYGAPIPRLHKGGTAFLTETGTGIAGWANYLLMFPNLLGKVLLSLFIITVAYSMFISIIGFDLLEKNNRKIQSNLFILLLFLIPLIIYTIYGMRTGGSAGTFYDGFILPIFPFAFILCSSVLVLIKSKIKKYNKFAGILFILIIFIFIGFYQIKLSENRIQGKLNSFDTLTNAGLWLKENTASNETIIAAARPQITYFSERQTLNFDTEEELFEKIKTTNARYLVLSVWEARPPWSMEYVPNHPEIFKPFQGYKSGETMTTIIYEINSSAIKSI